MYIQANELKIGDLVTGGKVVNVLQVGEHSLNVSFQSDTDDEIYTEKMVETELIFLRN